MTSVERRNADGFPSHGIVIYNDGSGNLHFLESNPEASEYARSESGIRRLPAKLK
jgi:hypothetical protein